MLKQFLGANTYRQITNISVSLTHRSRVTNSDVSEPGHRSSRWWLGACSASNHFLSQYWLFVNWTRRKYPPSRSKSLPPIKCFLLNVVCNIFKMSAIFQASMCQGCMSVCKTHAIHWTGYICYDFIREYRPSGENLYVARDMTPALEPGCLTCVVWNIEAITVRPTFCRGHFRIHFWMKVVFRWSLLPYVNWEYVSIGSGDGLAPIRRQAITWTNDDLVCWWTFATTGFTALKIPSMDASMPCYLQAPNAPVHAHYPRKRDMRLHVATGHVRYNSTSRTLYSRHNIFRIIPQESFSLEH